MLGGGGNSIEASCKVSRDRCADATFTWDNDQLESREKVASHVYILLAKYAVKHL